MIEEVKLPDHLSRKNDQALSDLQPLLQSISLLKCNCGGPVTKMRKKLKMLNVSRGQPECSVLKKTLHP